MNINNTLILWIVTIVATASVAIYANQEKYEHFIHVAFLLWGIKYFVTLLKYMQNDC